MSTSKRGGITLGALSVAMISMAVVLLLAFVKIYLSNNIYYKSRQTHSLQQEVAALKEENTLLQMRVEKLKYKSQITDTIFTISETLESEDDQKNIGDKQ